MLPEDNEYILKVGLNFPARHDSNEPDGHERAVTVPVPALEAAVDVRHGLRQVAGHEPLLVGGGQPRQQANQRVLNVRVLAQLRVLRNAEHALADSFEFFLQRSKKRLIIKVKSLTVRAVPVYFGFTDPESLFDNKVGPASLSINIKKFYLSCALKSPNLLVI